MISKSTLDTHLWYAHRLHNAKNFDLAYNKFLEIYTFCIKNGIKYEKINEVITYLIKEGDIIDLIVCCHEEANFRMVISILEEIIKNNTLSSDDIIFDNRLRNIIKGLSFGEHNVSTGIKMIQSLLIEIDSKFDIQI